MRATLAALLVLALASGCARPPPEAYVAAGSSRNEVGSIDLGRNGAGELCVQSIGKLPETALYCGAWQQPSAHVRAAGPGDPGRLQSLLAGGSWRSTIDARYACGEPRPVSLDGAQGLQLDCTGRYGGWPHTALGLVSNGTLWLADGVVAAVPAIGRSVAVLSDREPGKTISSATVDAAQAERAGAEARVTGDSRQFDELMARGARANLLDNPASAESAYSAAVEVDEKGLGKDNPNLADPLMHLALQLSNQERFAEADAMFARADALAPRQQGDNAIVSRLLYYEGLHAYNRGKLDEALGDLKRAEAGFLAVIDPAFLKPRPQADRNALGAALQDAVSTPSDLQSRELLALLVETKRFEGVVLRELKRPDESEAKLREADEVARNARVSLPRLNARLRRSAAVTASLVGRADDALADYSDSTTSFRRAFPGSRPLALVGLLNAQQLIGANRPADAAEACRAAVATLIEVKSGYPPERMAPCLDAFATEAAKASGAARQAIYADMFLAAQFARSSKTEAQISQAAARLGAGGRDRAVGDAIRANQDADVALATIRRRQQEAAEAARSGQPMAPSVISQLAEQEQAALANKRDREQALQAAAPNFQQLVQWVVPAADILKLLQPQEAFATVIVADKEGWTFLLRDGAIAVGRVAGGASAIDPLVTRIRASMTAETPAFDAAATQALYQAVFGNFADALADVTSLTVAPTGSLLTVPFGLLLTGPADPAHLGEAPWLVRRMAVGHVPSAGNFVALRQTAGVSRATRPWFGFGDFRPMTLAQARRSYGPSCGDAAQLLAQLPPLPSARAELAIAAKLLDASPGEELLGADFTVPAVQKLGLTDYRVLHFASHAILPSDLQCQSEPAIITSPVRDAPDATTALLTASDLTGMKLDADLVILSACNSGGGGGGISGGESLSALARSFFYAGARGLLVTHWEVSDQAATFLIADTLRRLKAAPGDGPARALQLAQTDLLDRVGRVLPAEFAHPFYWAPFALVGQSGVPMQARSATIQGAERRG